MSKDHHSLQRLIFLSEMLALNEQYPDSLGHDFEQVKLFQEGNDTAPGLADVNAIIPGVFFGRFYFPLLC